MWLCSSAKIGWLRSSNSILQLTISHFTNEQILNAVKNISLVNFAGIKPPSYIRLIPLAFGLTFAVTWLSNTKPAKTTVSTRNKDFIFQSYVCSMSVVSSKDTVSAKNRKLMSYNVSHLDTTGINRVHFRTADL